MVIVTDEAHALRPCDAAASHRIANRPIVCHVLDALHAAGASELAVVASPDALPEIRDCIDDERPERGINYLPAEKSGSFFSSLRAGLDFVGDDPCMIHLADGVVGQPLAPLAELLRDGRPDLVLLVHNSSDKFPLRLAAKRLLGIAELDGSRLSLGLAGFCMLGPGAARLACEVATGSESESELDFVSAAQHVVDDGGHLSVGRVRCWRRYQGDPLDLLEMNRMVLDQMMTGMQAGDDNGNRIEDRVAIHPTATVASSVILGPSVIGAGAQISDAYIGPYTSIGRDVVIEGAEIERSIIFDGAMIMHVDGRIEGSTVGRRARIFRDFKLPRAMRLHVGEGVEVALS